MLGGIPGKLLAYALAVLAVLGALWKALADARARGRDDAEMKAMRRAQTNRETRDAVEDDVAGAADARQRLLDKWTRDKRV